MSQREHASEVHGRDRRGATSRFALNVEEECSLGLSPIPEGEGDHLIGLLSSPTLTTQKELEVTSVPGKKEGN